MNTGEFIISLANQSNATLTEAQTTAIKEIATDLPEEVTTHIQSNLFTKDSALANTEIINKLKADALDPMDEKLRELAKAVGLDEGFLHNLKETKGTYNRFDSVQKALLTAQKVALEKAKESAGEGDQEALQTKINDLNGELATLKDGSVTKEAHETAINGYETQIKDNASNLLQIQAKGLFNGVNWAQKEIAAEVNAMTAMTLFNQELANKKVSLVSDNGTLKLQTEEGADYHGDDNKLVTPQDFAGSIVSGHKLEAVSNPNPTTTPNQNPNAPAIPVVNGFDPSVAEAVREAQALNTQVHEVATAQAI